MAEIRFARGKKENLNESALSDGKISLATDEKVLYIDYKEGDEVKRELVQTLTVNGHTVYSDVPSNAKFTDTVYTHPNSGVTAGTYKSVTVDKAGHVTNGSNPTTLAGYGITDAASKAQGNKADTAVQSVKIGSSSTEYKNGTSVVLPAYPATLPASDVSAWAKAATKPTYTASEVGADAAGSANSALSSAKSYTDNKIADLIGTADETMDTLGELADAIAENEDVVEALNSAIANKVDKVSGKGLSTNDYTTTEKNKLSGIQSGAEVNQNAFSKVQIGEDVISADTKTDTLVLVAGSNVQIAPDITGDKLTISATDTSITYLAGTGIDLSENIISNAGVRSVLTGSSNGTILVNTGGMSTDVAVKGLGSAAYTDSSTYAVSDHNHNGTYPKAATSSSEPVDQSIGDHWYQPFE